MASPDLIKRYGMIERGTDLGKSQLLESGDEPWSVWSQSDAEAAWLSRAPSIDDSAGVLAAAEEGLGYALARWTLASRALHSGTCGSPQRAPCPKARHSTSFVRRTSWNCPRWRNFASGSPALRANSRNPTRRMPARVR